MRCFWSHPGSGRLIFKALAKFHLLTIDEMAICRSTAKAPTVSSASISRRYIKDNSYRLKAGRVIPGEPHPGLMDTNLVREPIQHSRAFNVPIIENRCNYYAFRCGTFSRTFLRR